ncbi:MAG: hypothetical protein VX779_03130 [Candidatus Thermoplasmatota archaeon]|nr:hypothetical protein [Candidatus Thermoplasmatota archaeon]
MSDEFTFLGITVPRFATISGGLLVIWGIFSYITQSADPPSITAAIPALLGLPMLGLGIMADRDEKNLRHYMHVSMVFALLMALGGARVITGFSDMSSLAIISHLLLLVIGATFIFVGVRSFRHARMLREAGGAE